MTRALAAETVERCAVCGRAVTDAQVCVLGPDGRFRHSVCVASRPLTMRETAALIGLSWERFRKVWPNLCVDQELPSPYLTAPLRWDEAQVKAWKSRGRPGPIARAQDAPPKPLPPSRARERAMAGLREIRGQ